MHNSRQYQTVSRVAATRELVLLLRLRIRLIRRNFRHTSWVLSGFYIGCIVVGVFAFFSSVYSVSLASVGSLTPTLRHAVCVAALITLGGICIGNATLLGIGVFPRFSDAQLRRYPMSSSARFAARQILSVADPLWVCLGLVILGGALLLGAPLIPASIAAVAFATICYIFATLLGAWSELFSRSRLGVALPAIAITLFLVLSATVAGRFDPLDEASRTLVLEIAEWTPVGPTTALLANASGHLSPLPLTKLIAWIAFGILLLWHAESAAPFSRRSISPDRRSIIKPIDRIAATVGLSLPLAAKVLRYHFRSSRFWVGYLTSQPALMLPVFAQRTNQDSGEQTAVAMGLITFVGFASTAYLSLNMFGFDGPGFRRYFLAPISNEEVVRSCSGVPILLGTPPVLLATICYLGLLGRLTEPGLFFLLVGLGMAGLFVLMSIALVTSVLWPEPSPLHSPFRSRVPLPSLLCVTATGICLLFIAFQLASSELYQSWPWSLLVGSLGSIIGLAAYQFAISRVSRLLPARRVAMLGVLETSSGAGRV